jgi:transcriptional regulator with XRE-family HTH domain
MKLREFLDSNSLSIRKFAKLSGLTKDQIANVTFGRRVKLEVAMKINQATFGRVRFRDMITEESAQKYQLIDYDK